MLTLWRLITCIVAVVERNSRNQFKRNYLKNQKIFLKVLLHFWNLHAIMHILKKTISLMAQIFLKYIFEIYIFKIFFPPWIRKRSCFRTTFQESKCWRFPSTAQICTESFLSQFSILPRQIELENISVNQIENVKTFC